MWMNKLLLCHGGRNQVRPSHLLCGPGYHLHKRSRGGGADDHLDLWRGTTTSLGTDEYSVDSSGYRSFELLCFHGWHANERLSCATHRKDQRYSAVLLG